MDWRDGVIFVKEAESNLSRTREHELWMDPEIVCAITHIIILLFLTRHQGHVQLLCLGDKVFLDKFDDIRHLEQRDVHAGIRPGQLEGQDSWSSCDTERQLL